MQCGHSIVSQSPQRLAQSSAVQQRRKSHSSQQHSPPLAPLPRQSRPPFPGVSLTPVASVSISEPPYKKVRSRSYAPKNALLRLLPHKSFTSARMRRQSLHFYQNKNTNSLMFRYRFVWHCYLNTALLFSQLKFVTFSLRAYLLQLVPCADMSAGNAPSGEIHGTGNPYRLPP